jgi:nitroimidazol reductase NimA-like FMN-containing flavoprotein (pyridoxamine 5'-phosphate oxidase superfamily)
MASELRPQLDPRFSEPGAVATPWAETLQSLEDAELFWVTTVRADGRPHVTPLVAVWLDDALHFCTGAGEQKAINLNANPHVVLTTGCNDWTRGLDIVVEGDAVEVNDETRLGRLAEKWTTKWDGGWHYQVRDGTFTDPDDPVSPPNRVRVFSVTPTKILTFSKGVFSQTRYRP